MAANEPPNNKQTICAAVTEELLVAEALNQDAPDNGTSSIEVTIMRRRAEEQFCEQWANCLASGVKDMNAREMALRARFAACLVNERFAR